MNNWNEKAQRRVNTHPELKAYENIIMYDWSKGDEHWEWIATAPSGEIVVWAQTIDPVYNQELEAEFAAMIAAGKIENAARETYTYSDGTIGFED